MDLSTTYLNIRLPHPLISGASPLAHDLDTVRRLEDSGAAAIVLHSLFEEQITREQLGTMHSMESHAESFGEALSFFPEPEEFTLGPEQYLDHVRAVKSAVKVPVIASLNGITPAGWLGYAKLIEQAGADALELNVYYIATDPAEDGAQVENRTLEIVKSLKQSISMPVAVKLSPYYSSLAHFASKLDEIGVEGLVLFNRFYQPDIDIESLEVAPRLRLSDPSELLLRLRWLAILSGKVWTSLAVSGGVHSAEDAIKAIMAGAHGVQLVSALLRDGPDRIRVIRQEMERWLEEHEYESVEQMRGSMRLQSSPDPGAFERANYMRVLQSWRQDQTTLR